ncbi:MAG: hypothetical protein L0H96_23515 [Humibacillus sp.]|nr:hypothetical protein [Humibacillus sp.]
MTTIVRLLSTASNGAEGLSRVRAAVAGSVSSYGCGKLLTEVLSITGTAYWCRTSGLELRALRTGPAPEPRSTLVAVVAGNDVVPNAHPTMAFQVLPDDEGNPRVYVRPDPFGPVWSGIGLWHEFSHVNDYHRNDLRPHVNTAEMNQGTEGRAYLLEAIAIDVVTGGTFLDALNAWLQAGGRDKLATGASLRWIDDVQRLLQGEGAEPVRSQANKDVREGALAVIAHLGDLAYPTSLKDLDDAWSFGPGLVAAMARMESASD